MDKVKGLGREGRDCESFIYGGGEAGRSNLPTKCQRDPTELLLPHHAHGLSGNAPLPYPCSLFQQG